MAVENIHNGGAVEVLRTRTLANFLVKIHFHTLKAFISDIGRLMKAINIYGKGQLRMDENMIELWTDRLETHEEATGKIIYCRKRKESEQLLTCTQRGKGRRMMGAKGYI